MDELAHVALRETQRLSQPPEAGRLVSIGIATWAQALDIIGQCAEIDAMDEHAKSWIREADKFFDEHSPSLTKPASHSYDANGSPVEKDGSNG